MRVIISFNFMRIIENTVFSFLKGHWKWFFELIWTSSMNGRRSFCEMQLKEINYLVRFWSWTWCFCFFRFFLFDRSVAARCSCVNLHFTPVSIQSAYFKAREKQEKHTKIKNMAFPNPNYKEKVRFRSCLVVSVLPPCGWVWTENQRFLIG